ncbi:dynamin-like 120 kDa protein, mitochondrial isoform X1 [Wyeomyia smithii]|uniref:dynamin-like 120 kDa protein, mitochondrial isoform X1 n=2 Tax=Wyeomyia smithii TaxID=174621 RepID=UPI002467B2A4|nr:dynamin-like 120 kDa protein, mitochondrial isoform X1 [Wyeomyia smithii]
MAQLLRGKKSIDLRFRYKRPAVYAVSRVNFSGFTFGGDGSGSNRQNFHRRQHEFLRRPRFGGYQYYQSSRGYGMLVGRVLRGVLKLRYLILGGAIGGGVTLNKRYEEWKDGLPDMKWLDEVLPDNEKWGKFTKSLLAIKDSVKDSIEIDPRLKQLSENKINEWREWFDQRLDNAIEAAETQQNPQIESSFQNLSELVSELYGATKEELRSKNTVNAKTLTTEESRRRVETLQSQVDSLQTEIMNVQLKYQREIEKLEKENRDLRQQFLILKTNRKQPAKKRIKKSLIDMYSEVLDELSGYDTSYSTADHLPRVVVVGDQSSGKTSVLEAIAQARIFPRGSGEMMTRAPVKVTLSEGPYHVAQFRDSDREYDLTRESDLVELRRDVEIRMRNSVRGGKTVSMDVISMTVKGPGLQRMVLVDLPGIISTQTVDMAANTKDSIKQMTEHYMSNPNAIILCIQDGSVDAERSNVTDMVSKCDPLGKRTIFVLTKVDMAEDLADPNRIRKILSGKLFPMKALGYFAVVTGRGRKDDTIETIREYEEKFFKNSRLFQSGVTMSHQVTTRNLSLAVADRFWKMVRETIEQQADAFKATRFNLETEWKNNFPRLRESGRDEQFEKAKGEVLDEVVNLSQVSAKKWEELLNDKLWEKLSNYVFENVYLPAAQSGSQNSFNTMVDIKLRQWAEQALPAKSVEAGWEALQKEFQHLMEIARKTPDHDNLYDNLKSAVIDEAIRRHSWEDKAIDMLRVIQLNTLEDRNVHDKQEWDQAVRFFETSVKEKLQLTEHTISEMFGPSTSEKWLQWRSSTDEQNKRKHVKNELDKILSSDSKHSPTLSYDELTTVRKNLQRGNVEVETDYIRETWYPIYRRHFLKQALNQAYDCRKAYYLYTQQGSECEVNCSDVVLFWRIQQVLKVTANALRQQVINREARRLDKEIKEVLDEYGEDDDKKQQLLTGKRVTLAEELIRVRHIQEKLEEFINALNQEK